MTDMNCPGDRALFQLAEIAAGDPLRAHVDACPRCTAKLAAFEGFLRGNAPAGSHPADARRDLTAFVERNIVGATRNAGHSRTHSRNPQEAGGLAARLAEWWSGGPQRPVIAFAAVAIVAAAGLMLMRGTDSEIPLMRGDPPGGAFIETAPARLEADRISLTWRHVDGAERYDVEVLSVDLDLLSARSVTDTSLVLDSHGSLDPATAPRYWRVTARGGGRDIARSRPAPLPGP